MPSFFLKLINSSYKIKENRIPFIFYFFSLFNVNERSIFIKSWTDINFFLNINVSLKFFSLHKNRLKNVFLFYVNDLLFWDELEKFLNCSFLHFSFDFIYEKNSVLKTSFLTIVLLEIYLFEFDRFLLNLSFKFSSFKTLLPSLIFDIKAFSFLKIYHPLRLEQFLYRCGNLEVLSYLKLSFKSIGDHNFYTNLPISYCRTFTSMRYKDHLLLGFRSSNKFMLLIKEKTVYFLRSVLGFDVKNISLHNNTQSFYFIGFYISTIFQRIGTSNENSFKHSYTVKILRSKIFSRISLFKKRFFNIFLDRIRYELVTNFIKKRDLANISFTTSLDYKFWSYFFQIESFRSFSYYVLIFTDDLFLQII